MFRDVTNLEPQVSMSILKMNLHTQAHFTVATNTYMLRAEQGADVRWSPNVEGEEMKDKTLVTQQ